MADRYVADRPRVIEMPGLHAVEIHAESGRRHWLTVELATSPLDAASMVAFVLDGTDRHLTGTKRGRLASGEVGIAIDRVFRPKTNFLNWLDGKPEEESETDGP